jgi:hypothetical protein
MTPASGLPSGGRWGQVATVFRLVAFAAALATSLVTVLGGHYGGQRHVPVWLEVASIAVFVVTFVAAVGMTLADRKEMRTRQQAERLARVGRLLRCFPDNNLPLWSQLSAVDLGITQTRHTTDRRDPYVERLDADKQLVELVARSTQPYPFVVVVGASKAGKSRTAAHAITRALGAVHPQVVLPVSGQALADLMQLDPPLFTGTERTVVWLDNLLTADVAQLTTNILDAVAKHAVLVATITDQRYDEILHRGGDITTTARLRRQDRTGRCCRGPSRRGRATGRAVPAYHHRGTAGPVPAVPASDPYRSRTEGRVGRPGPGLGQTAAGVPGGPDETCSRPRPRSRRLGGVRLRRRRRGRTDPWPAWP